jgi:MFS family permease
MAVSAPARGAMIPNLVPREHLMSAMALNSSTWQIANIIGPSVAGVAVAISGFGAAYLANAGAHLVTLVALTAVRVRPVERRRRQSTLSAVLEGLAFVRGRSIILALLAMDAAAMLFGTYQVVFPVIGDRLEVGVAGVGLLFAAPGAGSLVGAALVIGVGDVRYKGLFIVGAIVAYCVALAVLAVSPWFMLSLLAGGALGFFDSLQATPRNALIQAITPDEIRGRVESFRHIITGGMPAMGQLYMGGTASLWGAPMALAIGAAACTCAVLGIAAARRDVRARDIDSAPATAFRPRPVPLG